MSSKSDLFNKLAYTYSQGACFATVIRIAKLCAKNIMYLCILLATEGIVLYAMTEGYFYVTNDNINISNQHIQFDLMQ